MFIVPSLELDSRLVAFVAVGGVVPLAVECR
jgi:hypothetical protein